MPTINPQRLAVIRERKDVSQKKLASKIKVDPGTVSRWERGSIRQIRSEVFGRLCSALSATPDDLCGEGPLPPAQQTEIDPENSSINLSMDTGCRNALALMAERYGVSRKQIIELAPVLFFIAAEQHLKEREERLASLRQQFLLAQQHMSYAPRFQPALDLEEAAIQQRDLFGFAEHMMIWGMREDENYDIFAIDFDPTSLDLDEVDDFRSPFHEFLSDRLQMLRGEDSASELVKGNGDLTPSNYWALSDALSFVGQDGVAATAIMFGYVGIHEMPSELRNPQFSLKDVPISVQKIEHAPPEQLESVLSERAKWVRSEFEKKHGSEVVARFEKIWTQPEPPQTPGDTEATP
jgi:transcriptional regulator with XRE-family HTH domain